MERSLGTAGAAVVNFFLSGAITWSGLDPKSYPHDALAAGRSISVEGSKQFNTRFPLGVPTITSCGEGAYQDKGIYMYSFSGTQASNILDPL